MITLTKNDYFDTGVLYQNKRFLAYLYSNFDTKIRAHFYARKSVIAE